MRNSIWLGLLTVAALTQVSTAAAEAPEEVDPFDFEDEDDNFGAESDTYGQQPVTSTGAKSGHEGHIVFEICTS
eukprot:SAG31_NODE_1689_length_7525_cov_3.264745_5_plen_74_part_00